jgi:hypothetical protein
VAYQVKEILTDATITFPLKEAAFLIKVKQGQLDYMSQVAPALDALMDEVEDLIRESSLPESTDTAYWENFLCNTLERELFNSSGT